MLFCAASYYNFALIEYVICYYFFIEVIFLYIKCNLFFFLSCYSHASFLVAFIIAWYYGNSRIDDASPNQVVKEPWSVLFFFFLLFFPPFPSILNLHLTSVISIQGTLINYHLLDFNSYWNRNPSYLIWYQNHLSLMNFKVNIHVSRIHFKKS